MNQLDDVADWLRSASQEVANYKRIQPSGASLEGWGQFLSHNVHGNQIGPYGTCAGIYLAHVADRQTTISAPVIRQMEAFWEAGSGSKLHEQNVRLAFLIFSLSLARESQLVRVRTEAIQLLKSRQLENGGWADAAQRPNTSPQTARLDVTAWVSLALHELNNGDDSAVRGARYILSAAKGESRASKLAAICVAAAVTAIRWQDVPIILRRRAFEIISRDYEDTDYQISFFDYYHGVNQAKLSRDYLCAPKLLSASFVLRGISREATGFSVLRVAAAKRRFVDALNRLTHGQSLYRVPEAKFATTMDQSLISMVFYNISKTDSRAGGFVNLLTRIKKWIDDRFLLRVVLPVLLLATAMATFQSPTNIPDLMEAISGREFADLKNWFKTWSSALQWCAGLFVLLTTQLPRTFVDATTKRLLK